MSDANTSSPQAKVSWRSAWVSFVLNVLENKTRAPEWTPSLDAPSDTDSELERLAHEADTPVDAVRELYRIEREKLEHSARIKTFVPVLAWSRVKELLLLHRRLRGSRSV